MHGPEILREWPPSTWRSNPQGRPSRAASLDLHMHYRREGVAIQNKENIFSLISMGRTMSLMKETVASFPIQNFWNTTIWWGFSKAATLGEKIPLVGTPPPENTCHAPHGDTWHTLPFGSPSSGYTWRAPHIRTASRKFKRHL